MLSSAFLAIRRAIFGALPSKFAYCEACGWVCDRLCRYGSNIERRHALACSLSIR
jgi:hypothetical protein